MSKISKLIFLDVDGVLNSVQHAHMCNNSKDGLGYKAYDDFCPLAVSNLCEIIEKHPDLKIVISSTWRIGCNTIEELKDIFKEVNKLSPEMTKSIQDRVIDRTPIHKYYDAKRGDEIQEWLDENKEDLTNNCKFVIIDDDSDMVHLSRFLIKTDGYLGLTIRDAHRIIDRLNSTYQTALDKCEDAWRELNWNYTNLKCKDKIKDHVDAIWDAIKEETNG